MDQSVVQSTQYMAAAIAVLPLAAVGLALGMLFSVTVSAIGRNPSTRDILFPIMILGFALTEAIGLFTLLVVFLILFA